RQLDKIPKSMERYRVFAFVNAVITIALFMLLAYPMVSIVMALQRAHGRLPGAVIGGAQLTLAISYRRARAATPYFGLSFPSLASALAFASASSPLFCAASLRFTGSSNFAIRSSTLAIDSSRTRLVIF